MPSLLLPFHVYPLLIYFPIKSYRTRGQKYLETDQQGFKFKMHVSDINKLKASNYVDKLYLF